jgi:8-amino-7-oxononanoate synthase
MSMTLNERVGAVRHWWTTKRALRAGPQFVDLSACKAIKRHEAMGRRLGIENPFFRRQEAHRGTRTVIGGKEYLNFAACDYLGLSQHPAIMASARSALEEFGTCVSASRMVGGELPVHEALETKIANFYCLDAAIVFVSGHAANVSTISTVMSEGDLIVIDEFVHNSAVVGARLSRAATLKFRHNNLDALEKTLAQSRSKYRNALIIVEGCYSTEADIPDLVQLVQIKERYGAWLMVDDAHALGVLGRSGRGIAELFGVDARKIDILMGTLSKTLAACGGYIAGGWTLIEVLKYAAPGFVFSVGIPPAMAAAALAAIEVMENDPERVARLQANASLFLSEARKAGLDTGTAGGGAMVPVMGGGISRAGRLMNGVFARGINPSPIIYPGVPINSGRLRFFITSEHTLEDIRTAVRVTKEEFDKV